MSTILAGTGSSGFHSIVHQSSTAVDSVTRPSHLPASAWSIGGGLALGAALFGAYYFRRLWMPSCRVCQTKGTKSAAQVALSASAVPTGDIYNYASWEVYGDLSKVEFGAEARDRLFTFLPSLKSAGQSGAAADSILLLNHGSYGAVPSPVQQSLHSLLRHVENCPDLWFRFNGFKVMRKAIEDIAPFIGADPEDVVFVPNATTGVNSVVRSMFPKFQKGDAIITMSLNYAAVNNTLLYSQEQTPVRLLTVEIPLPVSGPDQIVKLMADFMEKNHTDNPADGNPRSRIRLAVIDHITSATAMILPVKELTELFHKYRVLVCVDAAHAIGQVPVNLKDLGVDFYTTNCHKWLFTPKGCALLYTRREHQEWLHPVVTSHEFRNGYVQRFYQQGTRDETQFAAAAAAFKFYKAVGGERIRAHNNALAREAAEYLAKHFGTARSNGSAVCPWDMHGSMAVIELPIDDPTHNAILTHSPLSAQIMVKLLQQERCVGVITSYKGRLYTRISANIYNSIDEYKLLAQLLDKLFDQMNLKRRV